MPETRMQETPMPDMTGACRPCAFFLAKRTNQCSQHRPAADLSSLFFFCVCNDPSPSTSEPLLQTVPQLNAAILQLAQHADRETAMFANMALTFLVQARAVGQMRVQSQSWPQRSKQSLGSALFESSCDNNKKSSIRVPVSVQYCTNFRGIVWSISSLNPS